MIFMADYLKIRSASSQLFFLGVLLQTLAASAFSQAGQAPRSYAEQIRSKADAGDAEAQFMLGGCYYLGRYGVTKNSYNAVSWWQKSAAQDYAPAQISLGDRYLDGDGVGKDEVEAVRWFQKASDQDYPAALHRLGQCYLTGRGVSADIVQALRFFRQAATQGYGPSQQALEKLEGGGTDP